MTVLKSRLLITIAAVALALSAPYASAENAQVGDFALLDQTGKFHQLSWYDDLEAVVLVAHGNGDAGLQAQAKALNTLQQEYADKEGRVFPDKSAAKRQSSKHCR